MNKHLAFIKFQKAILLIIPLLKLLTNVILIAKNAKKNMMKIIHIVNLV